MRHSVPDSKSPARHPGADGARRGDALKTLAGLATGFLIPLVLLAAAIAAESHVVSQRNRAFSVDSLLVSRGDVVQFLNDDEFIHQIYVQSEEFNVDTEESPPGETISVPFTVAGTFEVHCHIHPKMRLVVTVQ